ncbi:MAG: helix-turn-helix domain-containing protein [Oscillospiraceae bacterium]|nr:helix-turn-helix domain-containing protein [Oscillospiraceae bacterium]
MDNRIVIGSRINSALAFSNKKQKELAAHLGVQDNTISYFCSGKRVPNAEQIIEISKFLGVSADYLLGLTGNKTNDITIKAICKYTGLSAEAVESLADYINIDYLEDYESDQFDVEAIKETANLLHIDNFDDPVQTLKEIEKFNLIYAQKDIEIRNDFIASDWFWDIVGFISKLNIFSERWEETFINKLRAETKGDNSNEKLFSNKAIELSQECDVIRYLISQKINEYINFYDNRVAEEYKRIITGVHSREKQLEEKILKEAAENGEHNPSEK